MKAAIGIGASLDDATQDALNQLYATRDEVEIQPIDAGSKGFLGFGRKKAKVEAILRPDEKIRATVFMRTILTHMKIDTKLEVTENGESINITLGEEASPLIGHHGQTLDAMQYLIARYLNEDKDEWRKVSIDIDNYRDRREDNLRNLATRLAEQALRTKRNIRTEPLSAPERRIIHLALKENNAVTTFSIGNGDRKRVVIASTSKYNGSPRRGQRPQRPRRGGNSGRRGGGSGHPSSRRRPPREHSDSRRD